MQKARAVQGSLAGAFRLFVLALTLAAVASLALAVAPASASKTHFFLETFGSAEQPHFGHGGGAADGLAVDQSTGDLLVIDSNAMTVTRYHPDGTPADFSALGTNVIDAKGGGNCATVPADCDQTPQNGFSFGVPSEQQLAVDNSGTVTDGDIYVTQGKQAAGNLVDIFASSGKYLGQITADKNGTNSVPSAASPSLLAASPSTAPATSTSPAASTTRSTSSNPRPTRR